MVLGNKVNLKEVYVTFGLFSCTHHMLSILNDHDELSGFEIHNNPGLGMAIIGGKPIRNMHESEIHLYKEVLRHFCSKGVLRQFDSKEKE